MVYFRAMFSNSFTLTKRHLGWLLLSGGIAAFAITIGIDIFHVGREGGIGPAQQAALGISMVMSLIGLTLIPLGKAPA
jgi:hypothetical protein